MSFRISLPGKPSEELKKEYDVIVVGGGPAGLTAALYSARFNLETLLITETVGGTLIEAGEIDDYPGIMNVKGMELGELFRKHVEKYKVPIIIDKVIDIRKINNKFHVMTRKGFTYKSLAVIIAVGSVRRRLNVPGEDKFVGKGVSYCAPCDAPFFKGKVVAVVGGGDAAASATLLLSNYATRVFMIHRRDKLRAQPYWVEHLMRNPKIKILYNKVVVEIGGTKFVEFIKIRDTKTNEERILKVNGIVIEIGAEPPKEFFKKIGIETTESGHIIVRPGQETNIKGIYAAGDCTGGPHKYKFDQIITAAAEGAIAAHAAYNYILKEIKKSIK